MKAPQRPCLPNEVKVKPNYSWSQTRVAGGVVGNIHPAEIRHHVYRTITAVDCLHRRSGRPVKQANWIEPRWNWKRRLVSSRQCSNKKVPLESAVEMYEVTLQDQSTSAEKVRSTEIGTFAASVGATQTGQEGFAGQRANHYGITKAGWRKTFPLQYIQQQVISND
jgi:hypothetical protein